MGIEFPHSDKETYVITRTERAPIGSVQFYTGDLKTLIADLQSRSGKHIFVDGGAEIVHELLKSDLIDEFYISVIPILLGTGIALFKEGRPELKLRLIGAQHFEKGLVQLHYMRGDA